MKRRSIIWWCTAAALISLCSAVACAGNSSEYRFEDYGYENPSDDPNISGVVMDGEFNESFWEDLRWHTTDDVWNTDNVWRKMDGVSAQMTSYFADEGVLFAVEIFDTRFTYDRIGRAFYCNSGVEVFLSADGADLQNVPGGGWEIMVDAVGNHKTNKYLARNVQYGSNFCPYPMKVYSAAHVNGGEINETAQSLSVELYVPYASLGLTQKPEKLYVNYAYNCNRDSNATRDAFCNVGMYEKGAEWGNASGWYVFTEEGLEAYDITTSVSSGQGTISSRGFAMSDCDEPITVSPAEGYYLDRLQVGETLADSADLTFHADGSVTYTVRGASQDIAVVADFKQYPEETMTGNLTVSAADSAVTLYAENGLSRRAIAELAPQTSSYEYELPAAPTRLIASADGCFDDAAELSAAGGDASFVLEKLTFGNLADIPEADRGDRADWALNAYKTDGIIRSAVTDNYTRIIYDEVFSDTAFAAADIVLPHGGADRRVGFTFVAADGDSAFITLSYEPSSDAYYVQCVGNDGVDETWSYKKSIPDEYEALLSGEGLPFAVQCLGGSFAVWLNGTLFDDNIRPVETDWTTSLFADGEELAVGAETWGYCGIYKNADFAPSFTPSTTVRVPSETENGLVEAEAEYGGALTVTLTPESGYYVQSLTINGKDLYAYDGYEISVHENDVAVVTFPEWTSFNADIQAVFDVSTKTDVSFGVTIRDPFGANKAPSAEGMTVMLTGLGGANAVTLTAVVDNRGVADFTEVNYGRYLLSAEGYEPIEIVINDETSFTEYTLIGRFIEEGSKHSAIDTSRKEEGIIGSTGNFDAQDILRTVGANEDFVISAVISYFTRYANDDARVGFYAYIGDGDIRGDNGGNVNNVRGGIKIAKSNGALSLQYYDGWWQSAALPQAYADAFEAGELRIGFGRVDGIFFLAAGIGDGEMERFVDLYSLTSPITTAGDLTIGMFNASFAANGIVFSDICFETGNLTSVAAGMDVVLEISLPANPFDGTSEADPSGKEVVLTDGETEYKATVLADGTAVFSGVKYGIYTLSMTGMSDQTYEFTLNAAFDPQPYAFWNAFLGAVNKDNEGYFAESLEDGSLYTVPDTSGGWDNYYVREDQPIDRTIEEEDFLISATLSAFARDGGQETRVGYYAVSSNQSIYAYLTLAATSASENIYRIQFEYKNGSGSEWSNYTLDQAQSNAFEQGRLRFAFGRLNGIFFAAIGTDDGSGSETPLDICLSLDVSGNLATANQSDLTLGVVSRTWQRTQFSCVRLTSDMSPVQQYPVTVGLSLQDALTDSTVSAEGMDVLFESESGAQVSGTLKDGTATASLWGGVWYVVTEGYARAEINVDATHTEMSVTLWKQFIDTETQNTAISADFALGTVTSGDYVYRQPLAAQEISEGEDLMLSARISAFAAPQSDDLRVGFYVSCGTGENLGDNGSLVDLLIGGLKLDSEGALALQFVCDDQSGNDWWSSYTFTEADGLAAAFAQGTLYIGLGRADGVWFLAAGTAETEMVRLVDLYSLTSSLTSSEDLTIGLFSYVYDTVTFSDLRLTTGDAVLQVSTMTFNGEQNYAVAYTVAENEDFLLMGTASELSGSAGDLRLGFSAWLADTDAGSVSWADNGAAAGVHGGLKVNNGTVSIQWVDGWYQSAVLDDLQETYADGNLLFGFGRIGGTFFLCAGSDSEDMVFCTLDYLSGDILNAALAIGKYAPDTQGSLSGLQFYSGAEIPVSLP